MRRARAKLLRDHHGPHSRHGCPTANAGPEDYNAMRRKRHARGVRDMPRPRALGAAGIPTMGSGLSVPAVENAELPGRNENRRVDVVAQTEGAAAKSVARYPRSR